MAFLQQQEASYSVVLFKGYEIGKQHNQSRSCDSLTIADFQSKSQILYSNRECFIGIYSVCLAGVVLVLRVKSYSPVHNNCLHRKLINMWHIFK